MPSVDAGIFASSSSGQRVRLEEVQRELRGRCAIETFERDHFGRTSAFDERRTQIAQLRTRRPDEQDGRVADPLREVLDEIEQQRFGPVDVVEDEHHRLHARRGFDDLPQRPERLLGRPGDADTEDRSGSLRDPVAVGVVVREPGGQRGDDLFFGVRLTHATAGAQRVRDRGERRRAGGIASRLAHARDVGQLRHQLACETGLAEAGGTDDRDEPRGVRVDASWNAARRRPSSAWRPTNGAAAESAVRSSTASRR